MQEVPLGSQLRSETTVEYHLDFIYQVPSHSGSLWRNSFDICKKEKLILISIIFNSYKWNMTSYINIKED